MTGALGLCHLIPGVRYLTAHNRSAPWWLVLSPKTPHQAPIVHHWLCKEQVRLCNVFHQDLPQPQTLTFNMLDHGDNLNVFEFSSDPFLAQVLPLAFSLPEIIKLDNTHFKFYIKKKKKNLSCQTLKTVLRHLFNTPPPSPPFLTSGPSLFCRLVPSVRFPSLHFLLPTSYTSLHTSYSTPPAPPPPPTHTSGLVLNWVWVLSGDFSAFPSLARLPIRLALEACLHWSSLLPIHSSWEMKKGKKGKPCPLPKSFHLIIFSSHYVSVHIYREMTSVHSAEHFNLAEGKCQLHSDFIPFALPSLAPLILSTLMVIS